MLLAHWPAVEALADELIARKGRAQLEALVHRTLVEQTCQGKGIIETKDVAYFVLFTGFCLFLTLRSIESTRWRG
jgi:hypothetical protein